MKTGHANRIKNISFEDAKAKVQAELGRIITKPSEGLFWTKPTNSTLFLDDNGRVRAVYNHTIRDFWWVPTPGEKVKEIQTKLF